MACSAGGYVFSDSSSFPAVTLRPITSNLFLTVYFFLTPSQGVQSLPPFVCRTEDLLCCCYNVIHCLTIWPHISISLTPPPFPLLHIQQAEFTTIYFCCTKPGKNLGLSIGTCYKLKVMLKHIIVWNHSLCVWPPHNVKYRKVPHKCILKRENGKVANNLWDKKDYLFTKNGKNSVTQITQKIQSWMHSNGGAVNKWCSLIERFFFLPYVLYLRQKINKATEQIY